MEADRPRRIGLGLASVLGALAGAVLFPTRAEGQSSGKARTRRPGE